MLVPNRVTPSILSLNSHYEVANSITLSCSVTYPQSDLIDVATNVTIQWLNSSNHTLHSYTGLNDYTEHTLNYTISNVKLSEAGQYNCSSFINAITNNPFILTSDRMTDVVTVLINSKSFLNYHYDIMLFFSPK